VVPSCKHLKSGIKDIACSSNGSGMSLVVSSLEIGKILTRQSDKTTFRAQGTRMYPNVRQGDLLHISLKTADLYRKLSQDELLGLKSSAKDKNDITRWILALYSKGCKGQLASLDFSYGRKRRICSSPSN
jgi:hypothetical protein